jgi:hypothetical protein
LSRTQWFLEHDGRYAEVFFNYNRRTRWGEFREKDSDYRDVLLAIFASALLDWFLEESGTFKSGKQTRCSPVGGSHARKAS